MEKDNIMNQMGVLQKLLNFYKKKGESYDSDFVKSVQDLIECGDIEQDVFNEFCIENDIKSNLTGSGLKANRRNITSWKDYSRSHC
jgi:hypothetical protein